MAAVIPPISWRVGLRLRIGLSGCEPTWHRVICTILCGVCFLVPSAMAAKPKLSSVADLRYGVALYHYYQADYMSALSELLVADAREGIKGHGDNPEIMEGGFSLAYGLETHASEIFERLLQNNRSQKTRDAAWFYLARMRYKNNELERAQEALDQISDKPSKDLKEDITALKINVLIRTNKLIEASMVLDKLGVNEYWLPYVNFNLGSAWARDKNFDQAIYHYNLLSKKFYIKNEHRALYDKAMTGAGYANLFNERYEDAIEEFKKVRLTSALSNKALLGYGWAAVNMEDYEAALKPWKHLASSSLIDENSQEALIALPFAYEKLGAEGLALKNYQLAAKKFSSEIERLDSVVEKLHAEGLIKTLEIEKSEGFDWLNYAQTHQLTPQLAYLAHLFAQEEFQGAVQDISDLLTSKSILESWYEKLDLYAEMLKLRAGSRSQKAQFIYDPQLKKQISDMKRQRAIKAQSIEEAVTKNDYFALVKGDQRALIERSLRVENNISKLRDRDPFIDEYQESSRRFKGLLLWEASEVFPEALWQERKAIKQLDESIEQIENTYLRIINLLSSSSDTGAYQARIDKARAQLQAHVIQMDDEVASLQAQLTSQFAAVLLEQRKRLSHYLAQSRLSIARIYDKGNEGEER